MDATIAFAEPLWAELTGALSEATESAGVILAGRAAGNDRITLTANRIVWVPNDCYDVREADELVIKAAGWMRGVRAAAEGEWHPIFFHTHPRMGAAPSERDRIVDALLERPFRTRSGSDQYASLILGGSAEGPTFSGQITTDSATVPIERIRIAGRRIGLLAADGEHELPQVFDRQVRAFGKDGQRLLRKLRAGVVGGGGTGSAAFELLTRLGVGEIVVIDDDIVTDTNITRIHGSGMSDVGTAKVEVAEAHAAAIGLGTDVRPSKGKITAQAAMEKLRHCDVVFGCTDDNAGRIVLARLAYWYLIPVFDMGVVIRSRDGKVDGIYARVTTMAPGEACALCRNRIDLQLARDEQQPPDERERLAAEGYAQGAGDPDPAVVTYTTLVAALAVEELKRRVFGYGRPASEIVMNIAERELHTPGRKPQESHFCADPDAWGRGDDEPQLGMLWAE